MPYILKASDCPESADLHPETIIAWQTDLPAEDDHRAWSIVATIEEVKAEYEKVEEIISTEKKEQRKKDEDRQKKEEEQAQADRVAELERPIEQIVFKEEKSVEVKL